MKSLFATFPVNFIPDLLSARYFLLHTVYSQFFVHVPFFSLHNQLLYLRVLTVKVELTSAVRRAAVVVEQTVNVIEEGIKAQDILTNLAIL